MLTQQTRFDDACCKFLVCICIFTANLALVGCNDGVKTPDNTSTKDSTAEAEASPVETLPEDTEMAQQTQPVKNSADEANSKEVRALIEKLFAQMNVPESIIHIPPQTLTGYSLNSDGKVKNIMLDYCPVTNEDVAEICKLKTIIHMGLSGTKITDSALEDIKKISLKSLELRNSQITKKAMVHMKEMKTLTYLALPTGFDEQSKAELQKALPDCTIFINNNYR